MKARIIKSLLVVGLMAALLQSAQAERFTVRVAGRHEVLLTRSTIQLSDIAEISSPRVQDDDVILALNRIEIAPAPNPGETLSLTAHDIISRIESAGVNLSQIGYSFPRVISVKRASRMLTEAEVQQSIEHYVKQDDPDATVGKVAFSKVTTVAPDAKIIEVLPAAYSEGRQQKFVLKVGAREQSAASINVSASVDRWAQVAVLRRAIQKGDVVDAGDVIMARLNLQTLPADAVSDTSKVIGLETKKNMAAGEVLQKNKLNLPTVIKAGEKVTIQYRSGLLEATATGITLDAAGMQESIRVRNEISNKVITGTVSAPGIVEVR